MASWIFQIFVLFFIRKVYADLLAKNPDNYGPYVVEWENFSTCRGPKSLNLTEYTTTLIKEPNNMFRGIFNLTVLENVRVEEIKIAVNTIKEGKKTPMWNYNVNKPCQHFMLAVLLEKYFFAKNCWLKKSHLVIDLPLSQLMVNYIGSSFFYGEYIFKVHVNSKNANLACFFFDPKFKKKVKN